MPTQVEFTNSELVVTLADGRKIATPLDWYPRLKVATAKQRTNFEIMPMGIHWPDIDEDLSIAEMLKGALLHEFFEDDGATSCVRQLLLQTMSELEQSKDGRLREFSFNRFIVRMDSGTGIVKLQDDLDPSEAGELEMTFSKFAAALRRR